MLVLVLSFRGCSESSWVPGVVVRPGTAPRTNHPDPRVRICRGDVSTGVTRGVAAADGQQELILHFTYRASTKLKEKQKLCLKGD